MADDPLGTTTDQTTTRGTAERSREIASLVIGALLAAFAVVNLDRVKVNWILGSWRTPLIIVIVVSFALGLLAGLLLARRRRRRDDG